MLKIAASKLCFKAIKISQCPKEILVTEFYKIIKGEAPTVMKNLFIFRGNIHNIRNLQIIADENKIQ